MDDRPIRVGIAGLGRSGWSIHARLLQDLTGHYEIVAVHDADAGRTREAAERFACQTHSSYDSLLADGQVEIVIVALPSHLHPDATIAALQAGKGVVCEKPMATNVADADRMIAVAEATGSLLTVFQNRRYDPSFQTVRAVVESGVLGRIVLIHTATSGFGRRWDWQTLREFGGGSLNNNGVHALDQALILMGAGTPEVYCHMERTLTLGDAEDHVKLILRPTNGPMIDVEVSRASAYPLPAWHIKGTQGGLVGSAQAISWKYINPSDLPERAVDRRPTPDRSYNRERLAWHEERWAIEDYDGPDQAGFYIDLYGTVREGTPLVVTPESVRRVVWVLEECHRQAGI
jgi:predicted dehydrogenase